MFPNTNSKTVRHIATGAAAGAAVTVMFHWGFNAAIPALFAVPEASFQQSLGLVLMAAAVAVLFKPRRRMHRIGSGLHDD